MVRRFLQTGFGRRTSGNGDGDRAPVQDETVHVPILGPLVVAILLLIGLSIGGAYVLQKRDMKDRLLDQIAEVRLLFGERFTADAQLLQSLTEFLVRDEQLRRRWQAGDRPALLKDAEPMFRQLQTERRITHLCFHDLERTCFLRVHDPNRYGDRIDRVTLNAAVRSGNTSCGMELGPGGTFTLRAIRPWRIDGRLVGYIELGEDIGHVIRTIRNTLDVELVVVVDKSFLDRAAWEERMRMLGRDARWSLSEGVAVIDSTLDRIPPDLGAYLSRLEEHPQNRLFRCKRDGRTYRGGITPLFDASNRAVGHIITMKDVGSLEASLLMLSSLLLALGAITATALIALFRWYIRRIERRLTEAYVALKTEISTRKRVEEELRLHRENLEEMVAQRTGELQTTNLQLAQEIVERVKTEQALDWLNRDLESAVHRLSVANRDLQDFLNVAAHDLKGPVRSMGTSAGWIQTDYRACLDKLGQGYLDLLVKRARRLTSHVDGILQYAGIWSVTRPRQQTDLNVLVTELVQEIAPPPGIRVVLATELPTLVVDRIH
ncbi:MAG: hypothetical protein JW993_21220, partial [Sedimentisphaerales bacterium]|nr:hypothetical protein [Sedimentisphaerales bacterium]